MSLEHAKKHAKAYDHVVTVAKELAAFARCRCHECWTGRGRHDPHGCLWADIEDLRLAVEALDSVSVTSATQCTWVQDNQNAPGFLNCQLRRDHEGPHEVVGGAKFESTDRRARRVYATIEAPEGVPVHAPPGAAIIGVPRTSEARSRPYDFGEPASSEDQAYARGWRDAMTHVETIREAQVGMSKELPKSIRDSILSQEYKPGEGANADFVAQRTNEAKDLEKAFAEDASNVESILLNEVVRAARKAMAHHCSANDRKHDRTWVALDEVLSQAEARPRTDKPLLDPWAEKFYAAFQKWGMADEESGEEAEAAIACWALRDQYEAHRATALRTETASPEEKK